MKSFFQKHKSPLSIVVNFVLLAVFLYFSDLQDLYSHLLSINPVYLILGILTALLFSIFSAYRWYWLVLHLNNKSKGSLYLFVEAFLKKEFVATFTSNVAGDIYSIFAVSDVSRKELTQSLLLNRLYDLLVVVAFSLWPLAFFGYLPIWLSYLGIFSIFISLLFLYQFARFFYQKTQNISPKLNIVKDIFSSLAPLNLRSCFVLTVQTALIWIIRLLVVYFTFAAINYNFSIPVAVFIAFGPMLFSMLAFVLPKSISGDSSTVAVGLTLGLPYPSVLSYLLIHKLYSIVTIISGFLLPTFKIMKSFKKVTIIGVLLTCTLLIGQGFLSRLGGSIYETFTYLFIKNIASQPTSQITATETADAIDGTPCEGPIGIYNAGRGTVIEGGKFYNLDCAIYNAPSAEGTEVRGGEMYAE